MDECREEREADEREAAARYEKLLPLVQRLERFTYYDDSPGYHRVGDVANGSQTRADMLEIRRLLGEWFPKDDAGGR